MMLHVMVVYPPLLPMVLLRITDLVMCYVLWVQHQISRLLPWMLSICMSIVMSLWILCWMLPPSCCSGWVTVESCCSWVSNAEVGGMCVGVVGKDAIPEDVNPPLGVLVRMLQSCVQPFPWFQVPSFHFRILMPWIRTPSIVLSLLLRLILSSVLIASCGSRWRWSL